MVGGLFDYSVYSWPSYNQKWHLVLGWLGGMVGGLFDYNVYSWPSLTKTCLNKVYIAFKKFVWGGVVRWGGVWSV